MNGVLSGDDVSVSALEKSKASLKGGKAAATTMFEPRLFHLFVDLVTPLTQIAVAMGELIFKSLLALKWKEGLAKAPEKAETVALQGAAMLLSVCGKALVMNDRSDYNKLQSFVDNKVFDRVAMVGSPGATAETESPALTNSNYIYQQSLKIQSAVLSYLRAFNKGVTTKHKTSFAFKRGLLFIAAPFIPLTHTVSALRLIFKPKNGILLPLCGLLS